MDSESSSKFIGSLSNFLRSLCNGYIDFDDGVELIGHIYLSVDGGKTGRKLNYFLNEKICKHDTLVTFISNSFHAQPECKGEGKEGDSKKDDEAGGARESVPKSTNVGTVPSPAQLSRSATPHTMHRAGIQAGRKRPGSPLSALTSPSQRRMQSSTVKGSVGSPANIVPSCPSSSSQDNVPSPSQAGKHTSEVSRPGSNQSDNATADNENDNVPLNLESINPLPDFASFLGSLTGDNQSSEDQRSPPDVKPDTNNDTDVTSIKDEPVSEHSCCPQAGNGEQAETQQQEHILVKSEVKRETDMVEAMSSLSIPTCQPQDSSLVKSECHIEIDVAEEMPHSDMEHQIQDIYKISDGIHPENPAVTNSHSNIHPQCNAMSAVFMSTANLKTNMPRHTGAKSYKCSECEALFSFTSELKRHMLRHTGVDPYKCTECEASFTLSGKLKTHMQMHTGVKPYKCTECEASFTHSNTLKAHMQIHTRVKPFSCTECWATFTSSGKLKTHVRIHTGVKPYKCTECEASFTQSGTLSTHMQIHTGAKPFYCTECDATFTWPSKMKTHMRIHTGVKPFKCTECEASFTKSCNLKTHMRRHTGVKPYSCTECEASFAQSGSLKRHMMTLHR